MATTTNKPIKQIQLPGDTTAYDIAAIYDGSGEKIEEKYLQLSGGTLIGPIRLDGGDGATAGKIILPNKTSAQAGGQITDDSTSTLFGIINANELTVGHGSYKLLLRGKNGDSAGPTYNGKKIILESNLAGTTAGVVKQDNSGDVNISNGIITVKNNSHSHSLTGTNATISDWSDVRKKLVEDWQKDVADAISALVNGAPEDLRTLDALAAALGDDSNFSTEVIRLIGEKVSKSGDTMTGNLSISKEVNPYISFVEGLGDTLKTWYLQASSGKLYLGGSISGKQNPIEISDTGLLTASALSVNNNAFTVSDTTIGSDGARVKISTSNGGAVYFGTEGANKGTMVRFDQTDGTCRLKFRASSTACAMVWEQPEEGAKLHIDLGKQGKDYKRVTFQPNSTRIEANLDITGNAATATTLQTPRSISISGTAGTTGTNFNGSQNISLIIPKTLSGFDKITSKEFAGVATSANAIGATGFGNGDFTWFQTSDDFAGRTGWASYLISNHGDGATYYHQILAMPFWGAPCYRRMEDGRNGDTAIKGWYDFITDENIASKLTRYVSGTKNYIPKFTNDNIIGNGWQIQNFTGKQGLGYVNDSQSAGLIPSLCTLAYWNGAYGSGTSATASNLSYCDQGKFGSIVTRSSGDYLSISGGTLTGSLVLQPTSGGEGGQIHLSHVKNSTTQNGIYLDTANGQFRIFGDPTKSGNTNAHGSILSYDPYLLELSFQSRTNGTGTFKYNTSDKCIDVIFT